ncbi:MAG: glycosyltransferase family 9 protein, partial [Vulcanimicrobiaceae bacterium]
MRVLLPFLPGLGDALTASPILRAAVEAGAEIDVLTMLDPVAEYARALDEVRDVIHIPLLDGNFRDILCMFSLRHRSYDLVIVPFPATRWQYAAVAWSIRATRTVIHDYGGSSRYFAKLARATAVPLRGGHRAWENHRLAAAAGLRPGDDISYVIPSAWRSSHRDENLLGVHAGTMQYKGNEARRWPFESFLSVIGAQLESGRSVRLFVGPSERAQAAEATQRFRTDNFQVVEADLSTVAQMIGDCQVFVANDSGLAHLASGLGVRTMVLSGMTNPERSLPIGPARALRPSGCPPCHDEGLRTFRCEKQLEFR